MRKIVHLTSVHHVFDTRIFHKECRTLVENGFDVVLVAPHDRDETVDGVRILGVPHAKGRLGRFVRTAAQVVLRARKEKADLYHIHDPELLPWARLCLGARRMIFDMHENVPLSLQTKSWISPRLRAPMAAGYRCVERPLLRGLPVVFAEKSYVPDYSFITKTVTVLNLPIARELSGIRARKYRSPTVGYMGAVSSSRGTRVTLRALDILSSQGLAIDWECVGPVRDNHIADLSSDTAIRVRGRTPHAAGLAIMARCQIGLAVLQPEPNYTESYPTKLFEYMALGLPVIASNFPLYLDLINEIGCGICVDPTAPDQIANAIRWLIEHPAEASEMGRRGQEAVSRKYNWEMEAMKLLSIYESLVPQETVRAR